MYLQSALRNFSPMNSDTPPIQNSPYWKHYQLLFFGYMPSKKLPETFNIQNPLKQIIYMQAHITKQHIRGPPSLH
jgi:hypothetical protein